MPMKPMAVDIVLIPDAHLFDQALSINADLVKRHRSAIVLHPSHCLPHISLAMGGIDEGDIFNIKQKLHALWRLYPLDQLLHTKGVVCSTDTQGKTVSSIALVKDKNLQLLHEKVMESVSPYFRDPVTEDMFVGPGPISESSLTWVNAFQDKSAFDNFWPHITLGYGKAKAVKIRDTFYADSLKLCQLGNHCTCQKVLVST